jgi:hypothetical protein
MSYEGCTPFSLDKQQNKLIQESCHIIFTKYLKYLLRRVFCYRPFKQIVTHEGDRMGKYGAKYHRT